MSCTVKARPLPIEDLKAQGHQILSSHSSSELVKANASSVSRVQIPNKLQTVPSPTF